MCSCSVVRMPPVNSVTSIERSGSA
jgi:hypothetical protein